jgi:hypothetical protein
MKYSLFIFIFFITCAYGQQTKNAAIPVIRVDKNLAKTNLLLSDFCSDISYTKLEFDEKYPVATHGGMPFVTNKYIFLSTRTSQILRYTRDGKKVQMIGAKGKGPGEYLDGSSFVIDEKNNRMYIRANFTKSILVYDYDKNKFLFSFRYDTEGYWAEGFANDGVMLLRGLTNYRYTPRYYPWVLLNSKGETIYRKVHPGFNKPKSDHRWRGEITGSSTAWKDAGNSFFSIQELGSDTIFGVSDKLQVTPRFIVDSPLRIKDENVAMFYAESSQHLFWSLSDDVQKKAFVGIYDKTAKKSFIYAQYTSDDLRNKDKEKRRGVRNDIDGGPPVKIPFGMQSSSYWHFFVEPFDLIDYIDSPEFKKAVVKDPKRKESLLRFVKTLQEDDNPVLVSLKLK